MTDTGGTPTRPRDSEPVDTRSSYEAALGTPTELAPAHLGGRDISEEGLERRDIHGVEVVFDVKRAVVGDVELEHGRPRGVGLGVRELADLADGPRICRRVEDEEILVVAARLGEGLHGSDDLASLVGVVEPFGEDDQGRDVVDVRIFALDGLRDVAVRPRAPVVGERRLARDAAAAVAREDAPRRVWRVALEHDQRRNAAHAEMLRERFLRLAVLERQGEPRHRREVLGEGLAVAVRRAERDLELLVRVALAVVVLDEFGRESAARRTPMSAKVEADVGRRRERGRREGRRGVFGVGVDEYFGHDAGREELVEAFGSEGELGGSRLDALAALGRDDLARRRVDEHERRQRRDLELLRDELASRGRAASFVERQREPRGGHRVAPVRLEGRQVAVRRGEDDLERRVAALGEERGELGREPAARA
mmetsp:Transcript_22787/g.90370  ORF Transcript_22787/g.90370 Transcript_22787/m.90370 type:complete len:424 (+) Transcript_22787:1667-2938(+)